MLSKESREEELETTIRSIEFFSFVSNQRKIIDLEQNNREEATYAKGVLPFFTLITSRKYLQAKRESVDVFIIALKNKTNNR
ncbi:hypothetical protein HMPREF0454_03998 [Hafnia alvei ATCC 51873]|uniref:Uncharacterized protein n=1 Tax=Hafnia alvei ATCC 51873 TaxID=1002364 RepID=G9YBV4_HAFAL|nr:hypothetical protein HMPREF0454_03998 [Hafnia alvei ATCC 51873]